MILPSDILAWRVDPGAPLLDRLIGWGERHKGDVGPNGAQYYHVATISRDVTKMYSAQPPRINLYPVPNPLPSYVEIYRLKVDPSAIQLAQIFVYMESRRGNIYDFLGVLSLGNIELGGLEFCSQLVEDGFAAGGILLCSDVKFATPDDIVNSALLTRVS